jgi:hypothetical protein
MRFSGAKVRPLSHSSIENFQISPNRHLLREKLDGKLGNFELVPLKNSSAPFQNHQTSNMGRRQVEPA